MVKYMSSYFIEELQDELDILSRLFELETRQNVPPTDESLMQMDAECTVMASDINGFNCLVDLCGIFKKTSVYEVKSLLLQTFGTDRFRYVYHIDPVDGSDRVLYLDSDTDVQFDEEFYK